MEPEKRPQKTQSRSKQRAGRKRDAKANRAAVLQQNRPKEDDWHQVDFGFMLHESSGRANGSDSSDESSSSSGEIVIPDDLPMLLPRKTREGYVMYWLEIKRVSQNSPYKHSVWCETEQLQTMIERTVELHNKQHDTDYRANEVWIECEEAWNATCIKK